MTVLVDDGLLSLLLRGERLPDEGAHGQPIFTTGHWYVRLCHAVLGDADRSGALSSPFQVLPGPQRQRAIAAVMELPADIGLVSLRTLAPLIGRLRAEHNLNILASEAVAAAIHLDAAVLLSIRAPRLEQALTAEGLPVTVAE